LQRPVMELARDSLAFSNQGVRHGFAFRSGIAHVVILDRYRSLYGPAKLTNALSKTPKFAATQPHLHDGGSSHGYGP